ncbi:hypothetical protein SCREM2_gp130 [Synechococcus phage S-CREM2]|nr:hypothetical protein SCREM2_gp130 [Synechococcus phage S-CREM2]
MSTTIRVVRNDAGNCINFYGTSNPTYWNACLSASIDEDFPDRINVRNDIRSAEEGTDVFEFFQIPYTTFVSREGDTFESPAEAAQYITDNANVSGDTGTYIFSETETIDAQREDTNTTVLFSNGDSFAVNSLRAVDAANGTITIRTVRADKNVYTNIRYYNVTVNSGTLSFNTIGAAVDRLNEVLSGGAVTSETGDLSGGAAVTSDPVTFQVYGSRITETGTGSTLGYTSTAETGNFDTSNGILSIQNITEAGEYFEFSQDSGDWTNTQGLTFGLFDETTYSVSDLQVDEPGNAVKSILRLRVKNSPFIFKDPASNYGRLNESGIQNQVDTRTVFRVGLDADRRGFISMQLEDGTFQNVGRTETAIASGTELKFVAIFPLANEMNGVRNMTVHKLDPAPELTWYYIESPDGAFYYPLFSEAEQANYVDEQYGTAAEGAGASHIHVFPDEQPSVNQWYMPSTYAFHAQTTAPAPLTGVIWNEISTDSDDAYAPAALNIADYNWDENYGVNLQIIPAGDTPGTVTGLPDGLTFSNGFISGTTPYVPADTSYTVTVVRTNAYGSTTETFTITIQDNASLGDIAGFTEFGGNLLQPNRVFLTHDALLQYDTQISPGQELTYSYTSGDNTPPTIGILSAAAQTNLDAFDPATDSLGSGNYDFASASQWDLRYVTGSQNVGGSLNVPEPWFDLAGWVDNSNITATANTNLGAEFKLEYGLDGYIKLYRNDALLLTSASTYAGAQTLTFAGFTDQNRTELHIPTNLTISNTGAGTTTPPSGFTDPLETGEMASLTLMGNGTDSAVVTLTETLAVNHRYIVPQAWIEANLLPHIAGSGANGSQDEHWLFGVPKSGVNWATVDVNHFHGVFKIEGTLTSNLSRVFYDNTATNTVSIGSTTDAYYEYGFEWDGTTLHLIRCNTNDLNTTPAIADGGTFVSVQSMALPAYAGQPLPLVMAVRNGGQVNLTTSGLNQIRTPFGAQTILAGENSNGTGDFKTSPSNIDYDSAPSGHSPADFTYADVTSLNAGSTYKFIYHPSMEADDYVEFRLASDNTTVYTTGVTAFGSGDPDFTSAYKGIEFVVPADAPPLTLYYYNGFASAFDSGRPISISGSTYVIPVTGITREGPVANQTGTNVMDAGDHGWISLDEQLSAGERLVLDNAFFTDFLAETKDTNNIFAIGLKGDNWTNTKEVNNSQAATTGEFFKGNTYIVGVWDSGGNSVTMTTISNGSVGNSMYVNTQSLQETVCGFLEISGSGNNIRAAFGRNGDIGVTQGDESTVTYADWSSYKGQTGDQGYGISSIDVVMSFWTYDGGAIDGNEIDWTGLTEVAIPAPGPTLTTSWTKALDFSGSSERAQMVNSSYLYNPLNMGNISSNVATPAITGYTSNHSFSRAWATAVVFSSDNNANNQHIWNNGEGAGSTDDNIYLRVDANRNLYFGWGRDGALNECSLGTLSSGSGNWYGIYIAHTGERLAGGHLAHQTARCFDIRGINLTTGVVGSNISTSGNWGSFGARMDRQFQGTFTVGGRGTNRNFHGKVASMVSTTLRTNVPMPADAEISMMVRDPMQWLTDYKVGQAYRRAGYGTDHTSNFTLDTSDSSYGTQVWLMGDGTNDAYAQIRNQVYPTTQNNTPLNMISMVSNDIETVNITGLT